MNRIARRLMKAASSGIKLNVVFTGPAGDFEAKNVQNFTNEDWDKVFDATIGESDASSSDIKVTKVDVNIPALTNYFMGMDFDDLQITVDEYLGQDEFLDSDIDLIKEVFDAVKGGEVTADNFDTVYEALQVDEDDLRACMEAFDGTKYAVQHAINGDFKIISGATDDEKLGQYCIEEGITPEEGSLIGYIDTEALESDYLDEIETFNSGDLREFVEELAKRDFDFVRPYFDYEEYGKDIASDYTGGYTSFGFLYVN